MLIIFSHNKWHWNLSFFLDLHFWRSPAYELNLAPNWLCLEQSFPYWGHFIYCRVWGGGDALELFPHLSLCKYKEQHWMQVLTVLQGRKKGVPTYPIRIVWDSRLTSPHPTHRRLTLRQTCSQLPAQCLMWGMALNGFGICFVSCPHTGVACSHPIAISTMVKALCPVLIQKNKYVTLPRITANHRGLRAHLPFH